MKPDELKEKMMKLWKDTFHDSDAYISLIFENYYDPTLVEYYEENHKLISALLGIPYEFGNTNGKLKGLYLCGLATVDEFRHRGIMHELIDKINAKAEALGYTFTFLIPASDSLINYYSRRKYETAMYRVEDCYTELHDFEKDYKSSLLREDERVRKIKEKQFDVLKVDMLDEISDDLMVKLEEFILHNEQNNSSYLSILHSPKDIRVVLKENLLSSGKIFISYNRDNMLTGVAFMSIDERKRIRIPKIYYEGHASIYKILDTINKKYPDSPISLYCYPEESDRRALWEKVYGAANADGLMLGGAYGVSERVYNVSNHAKPYGMIRILNLREILKFLAADRPDVKFSILVKDYFEEGKALKCDINNGEAVFELVPESCVSEYINKRNISVLNMKECMEILFRKKGSSTMIQEAFGIPRMAVNMALLLD